VCGDFHGWRIFVLKLHTGVLKCAFTIRRATVVCVTEVTPHKIPPDEEVIMFRRYAAILTLAFATFALAACTSPTAPTSDVCIVTAGSGTC
jgi:hypothetical protein